MLAYQKTYGDFCYDINHGQISNEIVKSLNRNFSESEKRSFKNSLRALKSALDIISIPNDVQVGLEFKVPLTNKRIDFIIAGEDEQRKKNIVIVELKQWDRVNHTDMNDIVMLGDRQYVHPSWQAYSYGSTITNFNEYIEDNPVNIYTCTFLHDYKTTYENEIKNIVYSEGLQKAPAFIENEWEKFAKFIGERINHKSEIDLLYQIKNGKIKPSKFLVDCLSSSLNGNSELELIDQQRIAFSNLKKEIVKSINDKFSQRKVFIVKGGAGTGKSLIALHLLGYLNSKGMTTFYVAKSSYIKDSYYKKLTRNVPNYKFLRTLFRGSGEFYKEGNNSSKQFDCLIVDEAHRLTKKTKQSFMFYGENQIQEIIHASKVSVFFIDETQQIDIKDFGTIENIKKAAYSENASVIEDERFVLQSQFRCNGSDSYIAWIEALLYNREYVKSNETVNYDIRVFDDLVEMQDEIRKRNSESNNPSRMLSGDIFPWISMKDKDAIDINIGDFHAQWNKSKSFAVDPSSIDEVGCIHTSQGMEFEYVGLIVTDDLLFREGKVITDYTRHPDSAGEFKRPHQKKPKDEDVQIIDKIIRNTYKVLFTRGQKGLYLYIMDESLKEYVKKQIEILK